MWIKEKSSREYHVVCNGKTNPPKLKRSILKKHYRDNFIIAFSEGVSNSLLQQPRPVLIIYTYINSCSLTLAHVWILLIADNKFENNRCYKEHFTKRLSSSKLLSLVISSCTLADPFLDRKVLFMLARKF